LPPAPTYDSRPKGDKISPIEHATAKGHSEITQVLRTALEADKPPKQQADQRLLAAAERGDPTAAALAVRAGADLETRDASGRTPLLLAVTEDQLAVARLLVYLGADPDALDDQHDTPWLVTGVTGSVEMLEVLLPAGPDLTIRNRFGGTSLIPASERGHVAYVRRAVRTGIDINHVNNLGWTALIESIVLGDGGPRHVETLNALIEAGASVTVTDRNGKTPLALARARRYGDMVKLLEKKVSAR